MIKKRYVLLAWVLLILIIANILNYTKFKGSSFNVFPLALFVIIFSILIVNILLLPNKKANSDNDQKVLVPMSVGLGYTFNLANKWVVLGLVIMMGLMIVQYLI